MSDCNSDGAEQQDDLISSRLKAVKTKMAAPIPAGTETSPTQELLESVTQMRKELARMRKHQRQRSPTPEPDTDEEEEEAGSGHDAGECESEDDEGESSGEDIIGAYRTQRLQKTDIGPEVSTNVADLVTSLLTEPLEEAKIQTFLEPILRPANVPSLQVQKVNDKLWGKLPKEVRGNDLSCQRVAEKLVKMITLVTETLNMLEGLRKDGNRELRSCLKPITSKVLDTLQAGAISQQQLSQHRREALRPHVNPTFRALCNKPAKEALELLGPDLQEKLTEMSRSSQLDRKLVSTSHFLVPGPQPSRGGPKSHYSQGQSTYQGQSSNRRGGGKVRPQHGGRGRGRPAPYTKPSGPRERWRY